MGDETLGVVMNGVIEIRRIREAVEAAGFAGFSEVEIFSEADWWTRPMDEVLATCIERHKTAVSAPLIAASGASQGLSR